MDFDTLFLRRKSVRAYEARPVEEAVKRRVLDATLRAPSAGALIAAQTAAMAAESLGLGSCYIGDIMENWEIHRDLLSLPRYTFPIAMLCLGYPTRQQRERQLTPRLPEPMVVMKNAYRRASVAELETMYSGEGYGTFVPKNDIENAAQALYDRKFGASFSEEMRRSVSSMLKDWS